MSEESLQRRWDDAIRIVESGDAAGGLYAFKALAKDGELAAIREVANHYMVGGKNLQPNPDEAEKWFKKSINEANDGYAYLGLAMLYRNKALGKLNYSYSLHYLQQIDEPWADVDFLLGEHFLFGQATPVDREKARFYFERASAAGNLVARRNIAWLNMKEKNKVKGFFELVIAAGRILRVYYSGNDKDSIFGFLA